MKKTSDTYKLTRKRLLRHRKEHKDNMTKKLDQMVYWTSLLLLAFFNIAACFFLIPLFVILSGNVLYILVGLFGLIFGILFNLLILGIEHLERRHSVIAGIFIPCLAILDIVIILGIIKRVGSIVVNSSVLIMIFITAFVLPYMISVLLGRYRV